MQPFQPLRPDKCPRSHSVLKVLIVNNCNRRPDACAVEHNHNQQQKQNFDDQLKDSLHFDSWAIFRQMGGRRNVMRNAISAERKMGSR